MSNGIINYPVRLSHPTSGVADRTLRYSFDDGLGTIEPYYMLADGIPRTLVGATGASGVDGTNGADGVDGTNGTDGVDGLDGVTLLAHVHTLTTTTTLPNTASYIQVQNILWNAPSAGQYVMQATIGVRAHSTGNDMRFEWDADTVTLPPNDTYSEEHKDTSNLGSMLRPFQHDLGVVAAGARQLELYFRKETTGGTAQIRYLSVFIWKVT